MTPDVQQGVETPAEIAAKPPPRAAEERVYGLFQTMDELQTRHGGRRAAYKDRVLHVAAALAGGSLLFAAVYAVILFLE